MIKFYILQTDSSRLVPNLSLYCALSGLKKKNYIAKDPLPPGISQLVQSGYSQVQAVWNVQSQAVGVFKKPMQPKSKELQNIEIIARTEPGPS